MKKLYFFILCWLISLTVFSQSVSTVNPSAGYRGQTLNVAISGQNTHFTQATSVYNVWFNQGSTTIYPNYINCTDDLNLDALFSFSNNAPLGYYDVNVYDNFDGVVTKSNGFYLNPNPNPPEIITVSPDIGYRAQTLTVAISGQNTHFDQATSVYNVWFSQGTQTIFPMTISPVSPTEVSAVFYFDPWYPLGFYNVNVWNETDGQVVKTDGFYLENCTVPAAPETPSGDAIVCQGSTVNYSVSPVSGAENYYWQISPYYAADFASGLSSATFNFEPSYYGTVQISVYAYNSCGGIMSPVLNVSVNSLPQSSASIEGPSELCQGSGVTAYTSQIIPFADAYTWSLSPGSAGTITGAGSDASVSWNPSFIGNALISVNGINSCGAGIVTSFDVSVNNQLPGNASTISGPTAVCQGNQGVVYSVPLITDAVSYTWTLPDGTVLSDQGNSVTVNYDFSVISGTLSVFGHNGCGSGSASTVYVNVEPAPPAPIITVSNDTLYSDAPYGNQWYLFGSPIPGATNSYYHVTDFGSYYSIVTVGNCSSAPSNNYDFVNSIPERNMRSSIVVYPNPVTSESVISVSSGSKINNAVFYNELGQVVAVLKESERGKIVIHKADFSSGIYFVEVSADKIYRAKFVVE